ncbi:MAG TPA: PLP-dependent aminotransferase family protein [Rhizomicrobium sp.]|jgi:DNA-binding transcriptional MocR family regulator|nr:PLP-dependent aminotransferase family protein [Rhizomicrobium sp.]
MSKAPQGWMPQLPRDGGPLYLAIAEAIAADVASGRLKPGQRLPPQRPLAEALGIDFTTVTRAYAEAGRRGLVEGRVGQGTYVRLRQKSSSPAAARTIDVSMNLPPRFEDETLLARMQAGIAEVAGEGLDLFLTYQDPAGAESDRIAGAQWLSPRLPGVTAERLALCPGTQGALTASLALLATRGDTVCVEALAYPGFLALAAHRGIALAPIAMDVDGILPDRFEVACKAHRPKALYLTPTFHNPTTATIPLARRRRLVEIARRHGVIIIEDDAYGALPRAPVPPLAALAPDCVHYIGGLSKCLSPALRLAYLVLPDARMRARAADAIRAFAGMASPFSAAIVTRWMEDGTAAAILAAIRAETAARQVITAKLLPDAGSDPECFHAWLKLPKGWRAGALAARARLDGIGLVTADVFAVGDAPEAVRIGLGAPRSRDDLTRGLENLADLLQRPPGASAAIV